MTFTGFTADAGGFFAQLTQDNTKQFFDAHREEYRRFVRQPMEDLLGQIEPDYGAGRVMRPHRDVRFSADKSPYRTEASMWAGEVGGVYLRLTANGLELGGGIYEPTRDQLQRAREAIDERPSVASQLRDIVEALTGSGFEMAGPSLSTAPRGFARDHPFIELLRLKHYAALTRLPLTAKPDRIFAVWREVGPLLRWGATNVGPARSWP